MKNGKISYEVQPLAWDTAYFGVPCARLELYEEISLEDWADIIKRTEEIRFLTIRNHGSNGMNNVLLAENSPAYLTCCNVLYKKPLKERTEGAAGVRVQEAMPFEQGVIRIADECFSAQGLAYTRFFSDPRISDAMAGGVYSEWAKNAFGKKGKYFVIDEAQGKVQGFIVGSLREDTFQVEVIATDAACIGKGIGGRMLAAYENFALERGIYSVEIPTQANNIRAVGLYGKRGYLPASFDTVYHWWK